MIRRKRFAFSDEAVPRIASYRCFCCGKTGASGEMIEWRACSVARPHREAALGTRTQVCSDACEQVGRRDGFLDDEEEPGQPRRASPAMVPVKIKRPRKRR